MTQEASSSQSEAARNYRRLDSHQYPIKSPYYSQSNGQWLNHHQYPINILSIMILFDDQRPFFSSCLGASLRPAR